MPTNPLPLTPPQLAALARAAVRQLAWGQRLISRENADWLARASRIPDLSLRAAALRALTTKRGHTDGAALFSILSPRRDATLVQALLAIEITWDYLDSVHELAPEEANGRQLHQALADAVDPDRPLTDWYRHHPTSEDGGYLAALVDTARTTLTALPSYALVRAPLAREMRRAQVLALNHLLDPRERDRALQQLVADEFAEQDGTVHWYELTGAASASLVPLVLVALAGDPRCTPDDVERTYAVYWPWVSLSTTMLDSYADRAEDRVSGDHSYVAHYPDEQTALLRISYVLDQAARRVLTLRDGHRHAVILAAMAAMYLTKDSVRIPADRAQTAALLRAGGSLPQALAPILRLWRLRYRQTSVS